MSRRVAMNCVSRNVALRPRNAASMFTATAQTPPALRRFARPIIAPRRLPLSVSQQPQDRHETRTALAGLALVTAAVCLTPLLRFDFLDNKDLVSQSKKIQQRSSFETAPKIGLSCTPTELNEKYLVEWKEALGHGAFGSVFLCHSNNQQREPLALKRIQKKGTNAAAYRREVDALQQIQNQGGHAHIVALRDLFEDEDYYYVVMDLAKGGEVFEDLVQNGAYSEDQAARMILQLASALQFLHEDVGLVHADLKLENLLLLDDSTTNVTLADFGCAASVNPLSTEEKSPMPTASSGTLAYWSPERFEESQQQQVTPAMDMWSVGILLYILLSNAHPFDPLGTATEGQIRRNIRKCRAPPAAPAGGPLVQDLLQRLLTEDPNERMTAAELIQHPWIQQHIETELVKLQAQEAQAQTNDSTASFDASSITANLMAATF